MTTLNEASSVVSFSGGGVDTYGAYAELIASAARDTNWALIYVAGGSGWYAREKIAIAIGGADSEVDRIKELVFLSTGTSGAWTDSFRATALPLKVSAGDRVSIRGQDPDVGNADWRGQIRLFAL